MKHTDYANQQEKRLAEENMFSDVYKALADPTRRRVLQLLRERDMSAGELAEQFDSAWPTLSRHFAILREADLIQGEKRGASIIYSLNVSVLEETLLGMMEMFQIDRGDRDAEQSVSGDQERKEGENGRADTI
jgi:DNA-binding transcriptional ArsR family regulator